VASPISRSYLSAHGEFRSGTDTPRKFLERCLASMDKWEGEIHAFVQTNLDAARAAADQSTERWKASKPLSPIDGMPVGIKDIIETADMPTEQGSPLFKDWRSVRDSAGVAALREAGAVIVGKTVTTEFAAVDPGPTRNPWDTSRTPGGSSSGSAAAVAAGIVSAALGTQVIGSIVRPASYCGCFGYKPSLGSINRGGSFDYLSQSCAGVLAATLEELWVVAREISARVGGDPGFPGLSGPRTAPAARQPKSLVILQTTGFPSLNPEAAAALAAFTEKAAARGVKILTQDSTPLVAALEEAIRDAGTLSRKINAWESRWPLNTYARHLGSEGLSKTMRDRLKDAEAMTLEDYQGLLTKRGDVRDKFEELSSLADACLTMSAPGPAPVGIESTGDPTFAIPGSLLGVPALSLPLFRVAGLPVGLQMLGFRDRDANLFEVAACLQKIR
jgi:Asp-tRNA(Asn)/Glu-tRNA(Gln) amidotransferase A subunit family amidase